MLKHCTCKLFTPRVEGVANSRTKMNKASFASTPGSIALPSERFGILKQSQSWRASEGKAAKKQKVTSILSMDKAMTFVTMHMDMVIEALHAQKDVRQPCDGTGAGAVTPVW